MFKIKAISQFGFLALVVAYFTWYVMAPKIFEPSVFNITNSFLGVTHRKVGAQLQFNQSSRQWGIETNLFRARKAWPNNSYMPNLAVSRSATTIPTGNILSYTLGLPLFWALLLFAPNKSIKQAVFGSSVILLLAIIGYILACHYAVINVIASEPLLRVITPEKYVLIPDIPNVFTLQVVKLSRDVIGILATVVVPAAMFFNSALYRESGK